MLWAHPGKPRETQRHGPPGLAMDEGVKRGGTITSARADEALTLDPFIPSDNGSIYNIAQVCEPLIVADATGTGLEPGPSSTSALADGEQEVGIIWTAP